MLTKELQDLAWSLLPKEFKEEVKEDFKYAILNREYTKELILAALFGEYNLTSDAEGEEMLNVSRKRVQNIYAQCEKIEMDDNPNLPADTIDAASAKMALLSSLFGSKCLPDEEPKPAEPKTNHIADPGKMVDAIIKDGFSKERRLNIAAMAMQGILGNPNIIKSRGDLKIISEDWLADRTLKFADALIAESEKGGVQ